MLAALMVANGLILIYKQVYTHAHTHTQIWVWWKGESTHMFFTCKASISLFYIYNRSNPSPWEKNFNSKSILKLVMLFFWIIIILKLWNIFFS